MPRTKPSESAETPAKNLRRSTRIKNVKTPPVYTSSTRSVSPVEKPKRKPKTPSKRTPVASKNSKRGRTSAGETTPRTGGRKRAAARASSPQEKTGRSKRRRTNNKDEKSSTSSIDADEEHASTADKDSNKSSLDHEDEVEVEKEIERKDEKTVAVEDAAATEQASVHATSAEPSLPTAIASTTAQATSIGCALDQNRHMLDTLGDDDEVNNESSLSMIVNLSSAKESASMIDELEHSGDAKPRTSLNQAMSAASENATAQSQDKTDTASIVNKADDKQPPAIMVVSPPVETTNESTNDLDDQADVDMESPEHSGNDNHQSKPLPNHECKPDEPIAKIADLETDPAPLATSEVKDVAAVNGSSETQISVEETNATEGKSEKLPECLRRLVDGTGSFLFDDEAEKLARKDVTVVLNVDCASKGVENLLNVISRSDADICTLHNLDEQTALSLDQELKQLSCAGGDISTVSAKLFNSDRGLAVVVMHPDQVTVEECIFLQAGEIAEQAASIVDASVLVENPQLLETINKFTTGCAAQAIRCKVLDTSFVVANVFVPATEIGCDSACVQFGLSVAAITSKCHNHHQDHAVVLCGNRNSFASGIESCTGEIKGELNLQLNVMSNMLDVDDLLAKMKIDHADMDSDKASRLASVFKAIFERIGPLTNFGSDDYTGKCTSNIWVRRCIIRVHAAWQYPAGSTVYNPGMAAFRFMPPTSA